VHHEAVVSQAYRKVEFTKLIPARDYFLMRIPKAGIQPFDPTGTGRTSKAVLDLGYFDAEEFLEKRLLVLGFPIFASGNMRLFLPVERELERLNRVKYIIDP
jgi:hypothetical protein